MNFSICLSSGSISLELRWEPARNSAPVPTVGGRVVGVVRDLRIGHRLALRPGRAVAADGLDVVVEPMRAARAWRC